jgi:hypothetical protein
MIQITTKFLPATGTKNRRIKATTQWSSDNTSATVECLDELTGDENRKAAILACIAKLSGDRCEPVIFQLIQLEGGEWLATNAEPETITIPASSNKPEVIA